MPHAWKCPRPGWIELGTTCSTGRHPCPRHRHRNYPNHSMIVVLWVTCQCQEETAHLRPKWKTYTLHALTSLQALPLLKSNFPRHMIFKQFWVTEVKNHRCRCPLPAVLQLRFVCNEPTQHTAIQTWLTREELLLLSTFVLKQPIDRALLSKCSSNHKHLSPPSGSSKALHLWISTLDTAGRPSNSKHAKNSSLL